MGSIVPCIVVVRRTVFLFAPFGFRHFLRSLVLSTHTAGPIFPLVRFRYWYENANFARMVLLHHLIAVLDPLRVSAAPLPADLRCPAAHWCWRFKSASEHVFLRKKNKKPKGEFASPQQTPPCP